MEVLTKQKIHLQNSHQSTLFALINERIAISQQMKELEARYDSLGEEILERMQDNEVDKVYGREYGYVIYHSPRYHYNQEVIDLLSKKGLLFPFVKMTRKGLQELFQEGLITQEELFFIEDNTRKTFTARLQEIINPDARVF